jgi:hypothetical protein
MVGLERPSTTSTRVDLYVGLMWGIWGLWI